MKLCLSWAPSQERKARAGALESICTGQLGDLELAPYVSEL
jgi:hypothetical protein